MISTTTVFSLRHRGKLLEIQCIANDEEKQFSLIDSLSHEDEPPARQQLLLTSFEACFAQAHLHDWHLMKLSQVALEWRGYVAAQLVEKLNQQGNHAFDWPHQKAVEQAVGHHFLQEDVPAEGGLQLIEIRNLVRFCAFEHDRLRQSMPDKPMDQVVQKAQWEVWLDHDQDLLHDQVRMTAGLVQSQHFVGTLHAAGTSLLIRNEAGQISHVFGVHHFTARAQPLPSGNKRWIAVPQTQSMPYPGLG